MTHSTNVNIPPEVDQTIANFKNETSKRALKLIMEDETLRVDREIDCAGTYEQDFDSLPDYIEAKQPCFLLTRLEKTVAHGEYVLLVYIPLGCPIRPRTIFTTSRLTVQRYISRIYTGITDFFFDDVKDCNYKSFVQQTKKDDAALSFEEILEKKEHQEQAVAQVQLPEHDAFTWPLDDDLKELLQQMANKEGPRIVAGMGSPTGDGVKLAGTGEQIADVQSPSPRYVAVRYNNNGEDKFYFVLYCPDTARPREKMMSSTCKASFLKGCTEVGLAFEQNFDIRDEKEFTDANLETLIHPPEVDHGYGEVNIIRKPKRPGRR